MREERIAGWLLLFLLSTSLALASADQTDEAKGQRVSPGRWVRKAAAPWTGHRKSLCTVINTCYTRLVTVPVFCTVCTVSFSSLSLFLCMYSVLYPSLPLLSLSPLRFVFAQQHRSSSSTILLYSSHPTTLLFISLTLSLLHP